MLCAALVADSILENGGAGETRPVPWWSFTKTVLAAAALVLVDGGALELDRPLPGKPFTLRHLLQHTSGLPEYGSLPEYHAAVAAGDSPWPLRELLARSRADELLFAPGEGWSYSNIGYAFVGMEIARAAGCGLAQALQELVLGPLGSDGVYLAGGRDDLARSGLASLAGYHPGWVFHGLLMGPVAAAARLLAALSTGALYGDALLQAMLTPRVLDVPVAGRPWQKPGYGLGLMIECGPETPRWGHTGGGPGSSIVVLHEPGPPPRTVAVFSETQDASALEWEAVRLLDRLRRGEA